MQTRILLGWLLAFGALIPGIISQETFAATPEEIPLWPGVAPGSEEFTGEEVYDLRQHRGKDIGWLVGVSRPTLSVYLPAAQEGLSAGIVICPGGGYSGMAIDHEGHVFAKWLCERGMVAGVLKYRCGGAPHQHPIPLSDAQRALRLVRSRASEWNLDPEKIGVAGFSAGGHLASTAGTRPVGGETSVEGDANAEDPLERHSSRANFMVLVYGAMSMQDGVGHAGSKKNLLGENPDKHLVQSLSNELQVTADTGPTFLVHTYDDKAVLVENSLLFYQALRKHKVPVEMHLYENGGHGFGMYRGERPVDRWPDLLEGWLKGRGLMK